MFHALQYVNVTMMVAICELGVCYRGILVVLGPLPIGEGNTCTLLVSVVVTLIGVGRRFPVLRAVRTVYGAPYIKIP